MQPEELQTLLTEVQRTKAETQTLELKAAHFGCPEKLYDSLSSFSNQDDGGIILFGVDEKNDFTLTGVYDAQDLQTKVAAQCKNMEPPVRPLFTVCEQGGMTFVSAEIPGLELSLRPCFYSGKGRLKGAYVRVGDADEPMTEYEVYSYEAFRKRYEDDIRPVERATSATIDQAALEKYLLERKQERPNLASLAPEQIKELLSITREGKLTLFAVLLFGLYPQAYFPQLSILATVVEGTAVGELGAEGERFSDNKRIEGTLPLMLEDALAFVRKNMRIKTIIDPVTGKRSDKPEYPLVAVREAILNALVHRDYSIHTEGMPIGLQMFADRLEIRNPGGLYGRMTVDQLGKRQADTRNPNLAVAMEVLGITENRYSGIPTIQREMQAAGLAPAEFREERGNFVVVFHNQPLPAEKSPQVSNEQADWLLHSAAGQNYPLRDPQALERLLAYCETPRSREELAQYLQLKSVSYAVSHYIAPLLQNGMLMMTIPDKPRSRKQQFVRSRTKEVYHAEAIDRRR